MRLLTTFSCALCCAALTSLSVLAPAALADPGTVLRANNPRLPLRPDVGPEQSLRSYVVEAQDFEVKLGPAKRTETFVRYAVDFPSIDQQRWKTVTGLYFEPLGLKPGTGVPAAVVVHHLGGSFDAEVILAQHLASNGVAAFFIELPNYGRRQEAGTKQGFIRQGPTGAYDGFHQAVLDVIRAGDFLRARPEVDPEQVGTVGVSLGAFVAAVARGVDPRLRRTMLLLGGGGLGNLLKEFPESKNLLEHLGVKAEDLGSILRDVDPMTFAARVHPADVFMLNALQDEIVPPQASRDLWEAFGRPKIKWYEGGHYGLIDHLPEVMQLTLEHLRGRSVF